MVVDLTSKYTQYAAQGMTPKQVAALTGCTKKTAKEALSTAREFLTRETRDAVALLERSALATAQLKGGVSSQRVISKRRWEDVALGLMRA